MHSLKVTLFLTLFLLSGGIEGYGQLPGMRRIGRPEGYNANVGYNIYQDRKGYIWIGTDNGGLRFDGKTFKVFDQTSGLKDIELTDCIPYENDHILFLPLLNNIAYCNNAGSIITSQQDTMLSAVRNTFKNMAYIDKADNTVWISNDGRTGTIYHFTGRGIESKEFKYQGLLIDDINNGKILGHDSAYATLVWHDLKRQTTYRLRDRGQRFISALGKKMAITPDGKCITLWDGTSGVFRVYRFLNDSTLYTTKSGVLKGLTFRRSRFIADQHSGIWIASPQGGLSFIKNALTPGVPWRLFTFLEKDIINNFLVDRNQNVWITTRNSCLYFISARHFENAERVNQFPLATPVPRYIAGNESGNILISYPGKPMVTYTCHAYTRHIKLNALFSEGARCILPLGEDRFVIIDRALAYVEAKKGRVYYTEELQTIKDICLYDENTVLASGSVGLTKISLDAVRSNRNQDFPSVFNGRSTSVEVLANKRILIGTANGLYIKADLNAGAIKTLHPSLAFSNITDIIGRGDDALISTNAGGLYLYQASGDTILCIMASSEKLTSQIRKIYCQNDSTYWLATHKGAVQLQMQKEG